MNIAFIHLDEYYFTFPVRMNTFIHIIFLYSQWHNIHFPDTFF